MLMAYTLQLTHSIRDLDMYACLRSGTKHQNFVIQKSQTRWKVGGVDLHDPFSNMFKNILNQVMLVLILN